VVTIIGDYPSKKRGDDTTMVGKMPGKPGIAKPGTVKPGKPTSPKK
jgi:hypothetical protein